MHIHFDSKNVFYLLKTISSVPTFFEPASLSSLACARAFTGLGFSLFRPAYKIKNMFIYSVISIVNISLGINYIWALAYLVLYLVLKKLKTE